MFRVVHLCGFDKQHEVDVPRSETLALICYAALTNTHNLFVHPALGQEIKLCTNLYNALLDKHPF